MRDCIAIITSLVKKWIIIEILGDMICRVLDHYSGVSRDT